ncbi:MAG: hypothetical protein CBD51_001210 [Flavobacteriales bacterium TMED191]|nr:MAG: hypothetical protein CBE24_00760 [bacterium TMED264]RPG60321.1 MAG: hypothetical protein CBD51_001210 [Flavobacteriales bacterium TMED191]
MAKRLTDKEKDEILESFKSGKSLDILSEEYNFNKLTIARNLKKSLGDLKYKELLNKNKSCKGKPKKGKSTSEKIKVNGLVNINLNHEGSKKVSEASEILEENRNDSNFTPMESFFEIAPLNYEIENLSRKELSSVHISEVDFPKVVYMIVDKKIELETKLLKDFPAWDFLPDDDLNRKTIEIFFDLNLAKRFCNKEQKVLKVPNTDVFKIAAPVLIERGISRIVCAENLIALG